jgi:glycosyltransferase involved in cell wall biosynthesis
MKVSVVVPLYNRAEKIRNLISMIEKQDYQNVELVIVDDGSSDNPENVANEFKAVDFLKFIQKKNGGANSARKLGVMSSVGDIIALLDSDDEFYCDHISSSVKLLLESNSKNFIYNQVNAIRGDGVSVIKPRRGIELDEDISEYLLCSKGFIQTSTLVGYKHSFVDVGFDESLPAGQDTDFAIRAGALGYRFLMKNKVTVDWDDGFDPARISSTPYPERRMEWLKKIKPLITKRAYYADRGWHYSKALFRKNSFGKVKAIYYYLSAVFLGAYSLRLSLEVFLQIVISKKNYHAVADFFIRMGAK